MGSYKIAARRWNDFVTIGQKIDHSKNILMYCMVGQFLHEMIPYLSSGIQTGFALSHPDLHLGNLYISDNFNITCIIDWRSATSGPITELLAPPSLGSSNAPLSGFLTTAFQAGFSQYATTHNLSVPNLKFWEVSERMWYFSRLTRLLSKNDYEHFRRLYELIYKNSSSRDILWLLHERADRDENKQLLAELQEDDITAEEVQEKELAWFTPGRIVNSDAIAVARKLTLMSEMNPAFLADHRLWRWIEEARKEDNLILS